MDDLTRAAIAGTARGMSPPATGLSTDRLFEDVGTSPEKELLLRAGARAVYKGAGPKARSLADLPPGPAPDEVAPACSSGAAELVRSLLGVWRSPILPEALERLRLAGLRLPHGLLPAVLNVEIEELRPAVVPVLGERGRWLAALNPAWSWAVAGWVTDEATLWEEGTLEERLEILRNVRGREPDQGLRWVEEVWKAEKAEARVAMAAALETGLRADDEPFLEAALHDRSAKVREAVAALLARLPASAYEQRAAVRADAVLVRYEPAVGGARGVAASLFSAGGRRSGRLVVEPPEDADEGWKRDLPGGDKPPHGVGKKAWRISQSLAAVPPKHWEERFGVGPFVLVAATRGDWEAALLAGWCWAAALHGDQTWALPLWERCYELFEEVQDRGISWGAARGLIPLLPQAGLALVLRRLTRNGEMTVRLAQTLDVLPGPWAHELGLWYLEALQERVRKVFSDPPDVADHWPATLGTAAEKLPPSCLQQTLEPLPDVVQRGPEGEDFQIIQREPYQIGYWRQELKKFEETLELRRRLMKEIPL